jgi:hypothetical protein
MSVRAALGFSALAVAIPLLLAGCGDGTPGESADTGTPESSTSATPEPAPTEEAGPTALPADCAALVATADPAQFGNAPLNDPAFVPHGPSGVVTPGTPPAGADARQTMRAIHELWCLWANPGADITHLSIEVGHLSEVDAAGLLTGLETDGYACSSAHGGTLCERASQNSQFPVTDESSYVFREDVAIVVERSNFPTNGLMASIVEVVFG